MSRRTPFITRFAGPGRASRAATPAGEPGQTTQARPEPPFDPAADFDDEELREFLEADLVGSQADPVFKERLRLELWRLLRWKLLPSADGLLE